MKTLEGLDHQDADKAWKPKTNPWVIALTVTLATFMEVLDSSIANVSLPHIGGALGATQNEAAWILTSYLVANAIVLPAAAYLTTFIGRKRFYMICVALFGFSSMLCGLAPSLSLLIFFRVLQGAGGGGLAPSEQAIGGTRGYPCAGRCEAPNSISCNEPIEHLHCSRSCCACARTRIRAFRERSQTHFRKTKQSSSYPVCIVPERITHRRPWKTRIAL
jgi:hypothetical protein